MLPRPHKLTSPSEFSRTVKKGQRAGSRTLVVHVYDRQAESGHNHLVSGGPRFGLVISKAVGNAVVRHRTARRLRHVAMGVMSELPGTTDVVIRALPTAGRANSAQLASDLRAGLKKIESRRGNAETRSS